jgi:hypothetical protein
LSRERLRVAHRPIGLTRIRTGAGANTARPAALSEVENSVTIAAAPGRGRRHRPRGVGISEPERLLLAFAAEHRFVLGAHVQALLRVGEDAAAGRLSRLCRAGLLIEQPVFHGHPATYRCTREGLEAVGSKLRAPNIDLSRYDHEVGAAWLWLAARDGAFGPMREVLGERWLRSRDGTADGRSEPLAVRLGGLGWGGRERLHYPDLLLVDQKGWRIAVELELSSKGRERREKILGAYASDARFAAVLYVVESPQLAGSIRTSAARLGIPRLVHLQQVRWSECAPRAGESLAAKKVQRRRVARRASVAPGSVARPASAAVRGAEL